MRRDQADVLAIDDAVVVGIALRDSQLQLKYGAAIMQATDLRSAVERGADECERSRGLTSIRAREAMQICFCALLVRLKPKTVPSLPPPFAPPPVVVPKMVLPTSVSPAIGSAPSTLTLKLWKTDSTPVVRLRLKIEPLPCAHP